MYGPYLYPPETPGYSQPGDVEPHPSVWQLVYTVPRHEKSVSAQLNSRDIKHVLPVYRSKRQWNARRVEIDLPLFPSYVFVQCDSTNRRAVLSVPGIVTLISFNGHPATVEHTALMAILNALKMRNAHPCAYLAQGRRVRIQSGPLAGIVGTIQRIKGVRIIVSVDSIASSISIEARPEDLVTV